MLEMLKKTVPDQMMEEADEKSQPVKDPSSCSTGRPNLRHIL